MIFILENGVFLLLEKLVYFNKRVPMTLCNFMKTFIGVFIYCFPIIVVIIIIVIMIIVVAIIIIIIMIIIIITIKNSKLNI